MAIDQRGVWEPASARVIGLVGPAGTGKSHRALFVAESEDVSAVIDDGLLIAGGKIRAGRSAKLGRTRLDAVRLAIFYYEDHARSVVAELGRIRPKGILVLGTSEAMIHRICDNLGLSRPAKMIDITELATEGEIEAALRHRRMEGKHVVPAPTFEVKRRFRHQLVAPLRLFYRRGNSPDGLVVEKSVVRPPYTSIGRLLIAESVLQTLFERFLQEHPIVAQVLRTGVQVRPEGVAFTADLSIHYLPDMAGQLRAAQAAVARRLEDMAGVTVVSLELTARSLAPISDDSEDAAPAAPSEGEGSTPRPGVA